METIDETAIINQAPLPNQGIPEHESFTPSTDDCRRDTLNQAFRAILTRPTGKFFLRANLACFYTFGNFDSSPVLLTVIARVCDDLAVAEPAVILQPFHNSVDIGAISV